MHELAAAGCKLLVPEAAARTACDIKLTVVVPAVDVFKLPTVELVTVVLGIAKSDRFADGSVTVKRDDDVGIPDPRCIGTLCAEFRLRDRLFELE